MVNMSVKSSTTYDTSTRNGDKAINGVLVAYKLVRTGCRSACVHFDTIEILSLHLAGLKELASLQRQICDLSMCIAFTWAVTQHDVDI